VSALRPLAWSLTTHSTSAVRVEKGEERWQTIGMAPGVVLLLVAHTWEEALTGELHVRIISVRRATKLERKIYEEGA
jgi:uncharacterized protein